MPSLEQDLENVTQMEEQPVVVTEKHRNILLNAIKTSGVFITSGKDNPNVMSTHWGLVGTFWNKDIFILPIRKSKLTHEIIDETKSFAISVPIKDMRNEIIKCDRLSGRVVNKFEELHLHPARAVKIPTYVISDCDLFFECRVLFSADMNEDLIDEELRHHMYVDNNYHTAYFAQIVHIYGNI